MSLQMKQRWLTLMDDRHLPGAHDQKTHGHGGGGGSVYEAKAKEVLGVAGSWSDTGYITPDSVCEVILDLFLFYDPDEVQEGLRHWLITYNERLPHDTLLRFSTNGLPTDVRLTTACASPYSILLDSLTRNLTERGI